MKPGKLVMLIKWDPSFQLRVVIRASGVTPPIVGAAGEIVEACGNAVTIHVRFPSYPFKTEEGDWWCVPKSWLMPIDDPDAIKAEDSEDSIKPNYPERELTMRELAKMGRKMLEEEPT